MIAQPASYALHKLFIAINQVALCIKEKCKLFDGLVGSILNYNACFWGYDEAKQIEKVHCKFIRKILSLQGSTNLNGMYGKVGRTNMKTTREIIMIK